MNTNLSALTLSVSNSPAAQATNDLRAIKPPVVIPSGWEWLWWTLTVLALAMLSYFAWRWWQKNRRKPKTLEVTIPPHERARRKLQEALDYIDEPRPFCILVSDAVRLYLEEAFSMRAPERTTEEFLDELQTSALLWLTQKQLLGDFLMRCDLVKFARHEPPVDQLQELYRSALRLIDETQSLAPTNQTTPGTLTAAGEKAQANIAGAPSTQSENEKKTADKS